MSSISKSIAELRRKKVFFFDLDGTLYLGNKLFEGVIEIIKALQEHGKRYFFLSNNSSKSTSDYLKKLNKLSLKATRENIILSQHPTISYLKKNNYTTVFLLGNESLKKEFIEEGFALSESNPDIYSKKGFRISLLIWTINALQRMDLYLMLEVLPPSYIKRQNECQLFLESQTKKCSCLNSEKSK